jgi:hypothetical protein
MTVLPNTSVAFQGHCVDAEGDQPFTFAWNFSGVAAPSTVQNPGAIPFPTVGVFLITFTCTDATGRLDPTSATRTITVNTPPESRITGPDTDIAITAGNSVDFSGRCSDPDTNLSLTFLWNFGGNASPSTATQQNPAGVVFNTPGTFTVSFACTDALGTTDPSPATVRVIVTAVNTTPSAGSGGGGGGSGGGGGCTLIPGAQARLTPLVAALGNIFLPMLVLGVIRAWCQRWLRPPSIL